jgi:antitoxin component YwqK of YwqJK toxin-antitoxin module
MYIYICSHKLHIVNVYLTLQIVITKAGDREWYITGSPQCHLMYCYDKLNGNCRGWHPTGQLQYKCCYADDTKHDLCIDYDLEGNKLITNYINGIIV